MKKSYFVPPLFWLATLAAIPAAEFHAKGTSFILDDKTFQIRAGEIHYPRVPREEWGNRIRMAKSMGLNTISTYVFWNLHEQKEGEFDFSGDKDVVEFIRLCGKEGMRVIVRPGPYVCAEWDLGGLPSWLLKDPTIDLRCQDPRYLVPAKAWMKRIGGMLQPLSIAQDGPVLMVQLENEFGSFRKDTKYLQEIEKALRAGGYTGITFSADSPSREMLQQGGLPGMLKAVNFGGGADEAFGALRETSPGQPDFTAEFWVGWFDQWGKRHHVIEPKKKIPSFEQILKRGASFNLYMFHGGTTRGLWNGANWGGEYYPTTESYDYSAPLDESGRPTEKYQIFRRMIQSTLKDETLPDIPQMPPTASLGSIKLTGRCALLDTIPAGKADPVLKTMEDLGQTTGFMLYRTTVEGPLEGELALGEVKDRVMIQLDGALVGISGRSAVGKTVTLSIPEGTHRLDLLVENMGRINYGVEMMRERKGLSSPVRLGNQELLFQQVGLPMRTPPAGEYGKIQDGPPPRGATLYRGQITVPEPRDTWLDMRGFGRGMVWFNGRNLGRYWKSGPCQSIFLPACWIKREGENEITVLELESGDCPEEIQTSSEAIWGKTTK